MMQRWVSMHDRCYNPDCFGYSHYGARGITVCDRWFEFQAFWDDMGDPIDDEENQKTCSIGRIDNNGNYEPSNCRWETQIQQNRNTIRTKYIEYNGETKKLVEWAEQYNVGVRRLHERLRRGWTIERSLHTPCPKGYHLELLQRRERNKAEWELKGHLYAARSRFRRGASQKLSTMDLLHVEGFDSSRSNKELRPKPVISQKLLLKPELKASPKVEKISIDLIEKMLLMKKSGRTIRDIGRILGIPKSTVAYHLRKEEDRRQNEKSV
jgi:hypothetical protein